MAALPPDLAVPLRVMIVDDSPVVRQALGNALSGVPGITLSASAPNGRIALQKIAQSVPDVCIVDLEMPEMDGIELLGHLRAEYPSIRILIHTSHGDLAESRAVQALMMGADDIFLKPDLPPSSQEARMAAIRESLLPKLLQFLPAASERTGWVSSSRAVWHPRALLIGVSTGGPEALSRLIPALPADFPIPVLIVQHMPPGFTQALARRLAHVSVLPVCEAQDGERIQAGGVWIAPGGKHLEVRDVGQGIEAHLSLRPPENSCRPSADVLFASAGKAYQGETIVLVMTGMGDDGRRGAQVCRAMGAKILVQDEASSVVWGMPGSVVGAGLADAILSLDDLPKAILSLTQGVPRWH